MGDRDEARGDRLDAVEHYLQHEFPERQALGPVRDAPRGTYAFTLPGDPPYFVSVSDEFLSDHPSQEIPTLLGEWGLVSLLRTRLRQRVIVTRAGLGFGPI